ncbi:MAG: hypothetical protein H6Q74_1074 [Firmicutes bacterium]|nr:hypothetical protein [Bacillota bacterium]
MDVVAWPLEDAILEFQQKGAPYVIVKTKPDRLKFSIEEHLLYVVRHKTTEDGLNVLLVAAKMGKEAD